MAQKDKYTFEWNRNILDQISEAVIVTDNEFNIQFISSVAEKITGWSNQEAEGKYITDVFILVNEIRQNILNTILKKAAQKKTNTTSFLINKHQNEIYIDLIVSSTKDKEGNTLQYTFVFKDITVEKQKEQEIKENEKKYRGLFEQALEGILVFDEQANIVDANPAACQIYQITRDEFIKLKIKHIFPHQAEPELSIFWMDLMRDGYLKGLYKYKLKVGEFTYIDFKAKANFIPGYHLAVFRDVTETVHTEKALKASEANLKAFFNNTSQRIVLLDANGYIVEVNATAQRYAKARQGRELEIGKHIFEYGSKEQNDHSSLLFERVRKGEIIVDELKLDPEYWIEIQYIPVMNEKEEVKRICVITSDISSRKRTLLMLEESEARFRSLALNSSDVITVLNADIDIQYSSPSTYKILGYHSDQLRDKSLYDFIYPDDRKNIAEILDAIVAGKKLEAVIEFRFLHAQGYYINLETAVNNLIDNTYVKGIVLNSRDITERKHQEENLRLLERAIDSSKNGIVISDPNQPDNPVIYVNKAFIQITGYDHDEVIGKNCRYLQNDDKAQPELTKIRESIKKGKEVSVVVRNYRKDGSLFWNQLNISPVFDREGHLSNFIGVLNDITERKVTEDSLIEITKGVSGTLFKDFYFALAKYLASYLQVDYVMIGEVEDGCIKTKAFLEDGIALQNFEFQIQGTPVEKALQSGAPVLFENLSTEQFRKNIFPIKSEIKAYLGVPLVDSLGRKSGIITVMSRSIFTNRNLIETVLNIYSVRTAAELERDRNFSALKQSEQKFRNLAENSPDLIYIIDLSENRIVYFNRKKILGYDSKDMEKSDFWNEIVHVDDRVRVNMHWKNFLNSNNKSDSIEYRIRKSDSDYEWAINRHSIIERLPDGAPHQILLNLTIITERKKAEDALRESEARLSALIENTTDIIWSVDRKLNITTFNSAFKILVKLSFDKYIKVGDNLADILPENTRDEWITGHTKALNGERFSNEFNITINKKSLFYEVSFNPIFSEEGDVRGVSVFTRDITQRKITEDAIIRTNFELDSFVYRASHDLRAPLRSVLGLSALVKAEDDPMQRANFLELIDKSVNKLDTFIADLTNFSRNSRLEVTVQKINFAIDIQDCIENLRYMEGADSIDVIREINIRTDFYSDNTRILIILQNLLSNSIKYKNPRVQRSYVKIRITITPEEAEIIVEDNGKGIKDEYLGKIFDMFFRASQESYGSGLGLYITKQVVEKLNGSIEVSSVLGSGTTFSIKLPNMK